MVSVGAGKRLMFGGVCFGGKGPTYVLADPGQRVVEDGRYHGGHRLDVQRHLEGR
jgi:hypothetical protein